MRLSKKVSKISKKLEAEGKGGYHGGVKQSRPDRTCDIDKVGGNGFNGQRVEQPQA